MAVKIRLSRGGSKKRPFYRIVVADERSPRDGRFIEKLGTYNPMLPKDHADRTVINLERVKYWLSEGAQPTDRIKRFLENLDVLPKATRNNPNKSKVGQKRSDRAEEKAEKLKVAQEALSNDDAPQENTEAEAV